MSTLYNFNAFSTDSLKSLLEKKEATPVSKRSETMNDIIVAIKDELKIRESKPHNVWLLYSVSMIIVWIRKAYNFSLTPLAT